MYIKNLFAIALVFCNFQQGVFGFSSFQNIFKPLLGDATIAGSVTSPSRKQQEVTLLEAVSGTQNGKGATLPQQKEVLKIVSVLETAYPSLPLAEILEKDTLRSQLDGTWFLQYTQPSELESNDDDEEENDISWKVENPEENITTQKYNAKGSVSAGGINVDVSKDPPKQIFDLDQLTVFNEVTLENAFVRVGGNFRLSENNDKRAVVSFKECNINLNFGLKLNLGFLFDIRAKIVGTDENGWLETTYLSDRIRIGRGNKGSLFVLTREKTDVTP